MLREREIHHLASISPSIAVSIFVLTLVIEPIDLWRAEGGKEHNMENAETWVICLDSWLPRSKVILSGHLAFSTINLVKVSRL